MLLGEGDIVDLGDRRFRVLQLPGHSPDSIGLLDERDGLFFSGDAIYDDTLIDDLPDSDRAAYRATMARIVDLPVRHRLWRPWRELFGRAHARDRAALYRGGAGPNGRQLQLARSGGPAR